VNEGHAGLRGLCQGFASSAGAAGRRGWAGSAAAAHGLGKQNQGWDWRDDCGRAHADFADHNRGTAHDDGIYGAEGEAGNFHYDIAEAAGHHVVDEDGGAAHHDHADAVGAADADGGTGVLVDHGAPSGKAADEDVDTAGARHERHAVSGGVEYARCRRHSAFW